MGLYRTAIIGGMEEYLDLHRHFGLLTKHTAAELFVSEVLGKRLTWDKVLNGRFLLTSTQN